MGKCCASTSAGTAHNNHSMAFRARHVSIAREQHDNTMRALLLLGIAAQASGAVVELTVDNFSQTGEGLWLVEFFAPWCGHCKHLKPIYEEASDAVAKHGLKLGAVDVTMHKELATAYDVKGYPTILWRRDGSDPEKFSGERTVAGFVAFAEKMIAAAVRTLTSTDELEGLLQGAGKASVAFVLGEPECEVDSLEEGGDPPCSALRLAFASVATRLQADYEFATSYTPAVVAALGGAKEGKASVIAKVERDETVAPIVYTGALDPLDEDALAAWILAEQFEQFPALDSANFFKWSRQANKLSLIFVAEARSEGGELDDATRAFLARGRALVGPSSPLAPAVRERFAVGWINGSAWVKWIELYEMDRRKLPAVFVLDAAGKRYWSGADLADVPGFAAAVAKGALPARKEGWMGMPGRYHRKAAKVVPALEQVPLALLVAVAAMLAVALLALLVYGLCVCAGEPEDYETTTTTKKGL